MKKLFFVWSNTVFHEPDVRPNGMKPICVLYNSHFHFNMAYCSETKTIYNDVIPESVTNGNCNIIPWTDVEYWCYMDSIIDVLKSMLNSEKENEK